MRVRNVLSTHENYKCLLMGAFGWILGCFFFFLGCKIYCSSNRADELKKYVNLLFVLFGGKRHFLIVFFVTLASEHVHQGFDVDETLVVDVEVIVRLVDLFRCEFLAPGQKCVPQPEN